MIYHLITELFGRIVNDKFDVLLSKNNIHMEEVENLSKYFNGVIIYNY